MSWKCLLGDWFNVDCTASLGLFLLFIMFIVVVYLFCSCKHRYLHSVPMPKDTMALMPVSISPSSYDVTHGDHSSSYDVTHGDHSSSYNVTHGDHSSSHKVTHGDHIYESVVVHPDHPVKHTHYYKAQHGDHGENVIVDVESLEAGDPRFRDWNRFRVFPTRVLNAWDIREPGMHPAIDIEIHVLNAPGWRGTPAFNPSTGKVHLNNLPPNAKVVTITNKGDGRYSFDSSYDVATKGNAISYAQKVGLRPVTRI